MAAPVIELQAGTGDEIPHGAGHEHLSGACDRRDARRDMDGDANAEPAKEVLGVERIAVVADRGYFKIEDIEACEKVGIDPYVPRPQRGPSVRAGLFRKDEFRYDPTSDSFLCPAG